MVVARGLRPGPFGGRNCTMFGICMAFPDEVARHFGVTRMPVPLKWFDTREVLDHLAPGFTMRAELVHVLFEVDIDETGRVTHVTGVSRPHLPPNVQVIGIEAGPGGPRRMSETDEPPEVLRDAVVAAARTMRFEPAERDGRPVPIRGLRLGARYSRDDLQRSAAT